MQDSIYYLNTDVVFLLFMFHKERLFINQQFS